MKQKEVFKKIGGIIKELNEQYEYLQTVEAPLNELELELFLANSHFLGDHVLILTKLNSQNQQKAVKKPVTKPDTRHEQNFFVPLVQAPAPEKPFEIINDDTPSPQIDLGAGSTSDNFSFMHEEEPETIRHELVLDESDWDDEDEPYQPNTVHDALKEEIPEDGHEASIEPGPRVMPEQVITPEPEIAAEKEEVTVQPAPEPQPVATVTKDEPQPVHHETVNHTKKQDILTINERMSAKLAEVAGLGDSLKDHSISDLKQAITLNDKLLFIKELFNGYSLAYSEAIEILNRFHSFNEAETFLKKNYVVKNTWEKKPETSAKFYALLNRRYA